MIAMNLGIVAPPQKCSLSRHRTGTFPDDERPSLRSTSADNYFPAIDRPTDPALDELLATLFTFAVGLLRRKGRFYPFGAVLREEGPQLVAAPPNAAGSGDAAGLLEALLAELRTMAESERLLAAGTCVDIRTESRGDFIMRAEVENAELEAAIAEVTYERRFPRRFRFDPEPQFRPGMSRIFSSST
jgi:hypothetical protein